jgi:hypothetical protein
VRGVLVVVGGRSDTQLGIIMWILGAFRYWLAAGVYNVLNKTRISCGKISETFWENVEAYSKTAPNKSVYFEILEALEMFWFQDMLLPFILGWFVEDLIILIKSFP